MHIDSIAWALFFGLVILGVFVVAGAMIIADAIEHTRAATLHLDQPDDIGRYSP